jgi:hypothetical protein
MQRQNRIRLAIIGVVTLAAMSGCATPNGLAALNDRLNEAADAVNALQMNIATLQSSLDSLNIVVAKQDTTIGRLATAAGIPVAK